MPYLPMEAKNLDWWPEFVREIFMEIGRTLAGRPLRPDFVFGIEIKAPWPDHKVTLSYFSLADLAAEDLEEIEGVYVLEATGPKLAGARWEFYQRHLDFLVGEAIRRSSLQSS